MKMGKVSDNAHYYVAGFGLWYVLKWIFTWYPASFVGLYICQSTDSSWGEGAALLSGIIFMLVVYIFLQVLIALEQYEVVAFDYLITLWPFIHQIYWYFVHLDSGIGGTEECFPLPSVDFCPFW
jgi:hypothetical protein